MAVFSFSLAECSEVAAKFGWKEGRLVERGRVLARGGRAKAVD